MLNEAYPRLPILPPSLSGFALAFYYFQIKFELIISVNVSILVVAALVRSKQYEDERILSREESHLGFKISGSRCIFFSLALSLLFFCCCRCVELPTRFSTLTSQEFILFELLRRELSYSAKRLLPFRARRSRFRLLQLALKA